MSLQSISEVAQIVQGVATALAIIVGGIWAWRKLFIRAEHETSITATLTPRIISCGQESFRILEICCNLINNGTVPCHFNVKQSYIRVDRLIVNNDGKKCTFKTEHYTDCGDFTAFNVPVGGTWKCVRVSLIEHPGIYQVHAFFAQTHEDIVRFYKRIGQPVPFNITEHPSGWPSEVTFNTEDIKLEGVQAKLD